MAAAGTTVAARPPPALQRATRAERLAEQRFRVRDVDADVTRLTEGGKQIDVFTEHVVELHVARRHVRVSDAARSLELEALRLRVRDVARRHARVTDQESVMNVLTERVRVSDVVTRRLTAALGARHWHAVGSEVHTDTNSRERVEFGDLEPEHAEPIVTMPEEEEEEDCGSRSGDEEGRGLADHSVTIEELESCSEADGDLCDGPMVLCNISQPIQAAGRYYLADSGSGRDVSHRRLRRGTPDRKEQLQRRLRSGSLDREEDLQQRICPGPMDWEQDLKGRLSGPPDSCPTVCPQTHQKSRGQRRWSKRNHKSATGVGIFNIRHKHNRRPPQHRQARARGTCCGR